MRRILVVEDDEMLREGIVYALKQEGYEADTASCLSEFQDCIEKEGETIQAVLLDVSFPDGDGRSCLRKLREQKGNETPAIFLTARNTERDMIAGFDAGGDDYVTKPFSVPLLMRRLKALLQRSGKKDPSLYQAANLCYDFTSGILKKDGCEIKMSRTEQKILELFLKNPNLVLTTEILLERVWDVDGNFVDKNTLSVNISRLRGKIEEDKNHPMWIKNVFGIGYKWSDEHVR